MRCQLSPSCSALGTWRAPSTQGGGTRVKISAWSGFVVSLCKALTVNLPEEGNAEHRHHQSPLLLSPLAPCAPGRLSWRAALCRLPCSTTQSKPGSCISCSRAFPPCNNLSLFFNVVVTLWFNQYSQFVSSPGCNKIVFQVLKHPIKVCKAVVLSLSHS